MNRLEQERDLVKIGAPVDPHLELAEIHRRVIGAGGPALLFTNVQGSPFPVLSNLFGTKKRVEMAVGSRPEKMINNMVESLDKLMPPSVKSLWQERRWLRDLAHVGLKKIPGHKAPVVERKIPANLRQFPVITSWQQDGGPFITQPLVYTEDPLTGQHNLGMYRMQVFSPDETGMHWQIHKGGGFHYYEAEQVNQSLPVTVFLGGPPVLTLAAIAPLPERIPELILASFLLGDKLDVTRLSGHPHPLIAEADFALLGQVDPGKRRLEGPFGDHYGYYSLAHDFPVFKIKDIYHRKDAVFPVTVVGKPKQEDYFIGDYLQELLAPLFPLVMPGVKELWTYGEAGFHALAAARVRESYERESLSYAFRILGEGQLTLTKFLLLTDSGCNLRKFDQVLENVLARFDPSRDLLILNDTSMDTLDYTGRKFNLGSKAVMKGTGRIKRTLPRCYEGGLLPGIDAIQVFCPGCLVVSGRPFLEAPKLGEEVLALGKEHLRAWPLLVLVDDAEKITDQTTFLWTIFTRFDPAWDIHGDCEIRQNKICYQGPVLMDARIKPDYPEELMPREDIVGKVSRRWKEYFPNHPNYI